MAGFSIAVVACILPFVIGTLGMGRPRVVVGVGGVIAFGCVVALAAQRPPTERPIPLWFVAGLVLLLYGIWCGGLWLGMRYKRMRRATPG
ncbi:MAG: hypothetical protein ACJ76O_03900 [Gaiellaceae bacterium]